MTPEIPQADTDSDFTPVTRKSMPLFRWILRFLSFTLGLAFVFFGLYFGYGAWSLYAALALFTIGLSIPYPRISIALAVLLFAVLAIPKDILPTIEDLFPDYREGMTPQEVEISIRQIQNIRIEGPERWGRPEALALHQDNYNKPSPFRHPFREMVLMYRIHEKGCNLYLFFEKKPGPPERLELVDFFIAGRG